MRPKNRYQEHIVELHEKLPPITEKQKQWAFDHCFEPKGFFSKGKGWCSQCGCAFEEATSELIIDIVGREMACPKCGAKLKLENSRKQKVQESWYYTILQTKQGFQVCRHFIVEKSIRKGGEAHYAINEAVQNWIDEYGKETIIARPVKQIPMVYDKWDFNKPMSLKSGRQHTLSYAPNKYDINACHIYPKRNILPKIKRNGYTSRFTDISQSELFKLLLSDREAEILAKNKQFDLLYYKWKQGAPKLPYWHAVRIAIRNKYIIKDASMYADYFYLLEYFQLDTHSPRYVCPNDLKAEHDKLMKRKNRIEQRKEIKKKQEEALAWEEDYKKSKGKYFGICFGNENIVITVIQSVAEMAEEGTAMHHCVYAMGYYKKEEALILSAKDKSGNRIETIEVNLKTFEVIQSRGVCNKNTEQHNEIVKLVRENINLIRKAA